MTIDITNVGTHTVGNCSNDNVDVVTSVTASVKTLKTLENNQWKSWTKGTDPLFQGFTQFKPGRGYVVVTDGSGTINLPDTILDYNNVDIVDGLNFLAPPKTIDNFKGIFPRAKVETAKSIINGQWKSWTKGTDPLFQGFTSVAEKSGYVVNVSKEYQNLLFSNQTKDGVTIRVSNYSHIISSNEYANGISYTDPYGAGEFNYNPKQFDNSIPAMVMFAKAGTVMFKLDYAGEYDGDTFVVKQGTKYYTATFTENISSSTPTIMLEIPGLGGDLTLSYNGLTFNDTLPKRVMNVIVGQNSCIIEYPPAYEGQPFILSTGQYKYYESTFQEVQLELQEV